MPIKQEITQEDLAEVLDGVRWHARKYFSSWCPIDQHAKPALTVYEDGAYCLSCQQRFSLSYLYRRVTNNRQQRNPSIIKSNNINANYPPWRSWLGQFNTWEEIVKQAIDNLQTFPFIGRYIYNRGISQATIDVARLGVIDDWVVFPCFTVDDKLIDMSVRNMKTKVFGVRPHTQGESTHLFAPDWNRITKASTVIIPFGMFDCLSVYEAGYATLTSISGKQLHAEQLSAIQKQFVVIPDYNEYDSALKLVRQLGWRGKLREVPWWKYDGCKDLNDIHLKFGLDELKILMSV